MNFHQFTFHLLLLVVLLLAGSQGQIQNEDTVIGNDKPTAKSSTAEELCPKPEDIAPCVCRKSEYSDSLYMNCNQVTSEQELQQVFSDNTKFPKKNFYEFTIENVSEITKLDTDFNGITFQWFIINELHSLTEITARFFSSMKETFEIVDMFQVPLLESFPFSELPTYKAIYRISIRYSSIASLPRLVSDKLKQIQFSESKISELIPGTFDDAPSLEMIAFDNCPISILKARTIPLREIFNGISFTFTNLSVIEPDAFYSTANKTGRTYLDLSNNKIRFLEEKTYGPLMPKLNELDLQGNPISCGCEILWLIENREYVKTISFSISEPTCANGIFIQDLNVDIIRKNCRN